MLSLSTKVCPKCGVEKDRSEFWKQSSAKDGLQSRCKPCFYTWRAEADQRYMESGKHRTRQREGHYRRKFGITVEQFHAMADAQNGLCAICEKPPGEKALHVDHNHETGNVRGLLCYRCNVALGYMADDPNRMIAAAMYLLQTEGGQ